MSAAGLLSAATEEIVAYKARTFLSILSVVVGIASITLIVAVGEVGRAAAVSTLERQSGRSATVSVGLSVPSWSQVDVYGVASELRRAALDSGARDSVVDASVDGSIAVGGLERPTQIVGTQPELSDIRRLKMVLGRWMNPDDDVLLAPAVVLNRPLAADLGVVLPASAMSDVSVNIGQRVAVRLVGIVDDGQPTSIAYMPLTSLRSWSLTSPTPRLLIWVSPDLLGRTLDRVSWLAGQLDSRIDPQRTDDPEAVDDLIRIIQAVLAGIAALALVSGGIGIVNLGLVTVGQRSREFAIRRAFGATRAAIFSMVCIEIALTVLVAGILGIAVAVGGTLVLSALTSPMIGVTDLPPFPMSAVTLGALVSVGLAVIAGIAPARAATSKSIIRAIRD